MWPGDLLSIFRAAAAPSVNFRQLSVPPRDFLSTSVNFLCGHNNFRELSEWLRELPQACYTWKQLKNGRLNTYLSSAVSLSQ